MKQPSAKRDRLPGGVVSHMTTEHTPSSPGSNGHAQSPFQWHQFCVCIVAHSAIYQRGNILFVLGGVASLQMAKLFVKSQIIRAARRLMAVPVAVKSSKSFISSCFWNIFLSRQKKDLFLELLFLRGRHFDWNHINTAPSSRTNYRSFILSVQSKFVNFFPSMFSSKNRYISI